jgi:uncharacterized protein (DUF362 family)/Pyruvate/2-oxoacid:ferredoxin oxidoreductase delta subunit
MFDTIALYKCDTYDHLEVKNQMVKMLNEIDGLDFIKPGMKIGIKANLAAGMSPEKSGTTHPMVIRALSELIIEKGATVVIGDSPGGIYTDWFVNNIYKACGLVDMVKELGDGASLNQDFSEKNAEYRDAVKIKTFVYTGWLDNVDAIINVCKLKSHAMLGMTAAVKNIFGTIPGTTKPEYHMRFPEKSDFANMMVDLNEYFKPALYVVDAIDGMEGNGPTAGEVRHIGALLASKRPYALDLACANIIGMELADVETMVVASQRGLGPKSLDELNIVGDTTLQDVRVPDFKRATIQRSIEFTQEGPLGWVQGALLKAALSTKPGLKKNECVGCKKCYNICPAHAITMVPYENRSIPKIDRSKCIKCFCCQEFCPKGAMKVHYNILGKIVNRINN